MFGRLREGTEVSVVCTDTNYQQQQQQQHHHQQQQYPAAVPGSSIRQLQHQHPAVAVTTSSETSNSSNIVPAQSQLPKWMTTAMANVELRLITTLTTPSVVLSSNPAAAEPTDRPLAALPYLILPSPSQPLLHRPSLQPLTLPHPYTPAAPLPCRTRLSHSTEVLLLCNSTTPPSSCHSAPGVFQVFFEGSHSLQPAPARHKKKTNPDMRFVLFYDKREVILRLTSATYPKAYPSDARYSDPSPTR